MKEKRTPHPQMSVLDLLQDWPEAIPVFIRYRMACVGCSMSAFETLHDAARIYGISPEVFLADVRNAAEMSEPPNNPALE
jgi:hybrid cluster-associated redox disulfide protein